MVQPINLNKIRKATERAKKRQRADENAVKFGRNKAERVLLAAQSDKMRQRLDQHRFEDDEQ
jgi:hypothetical protein